MSDLLAPILAAVQDESEAFWCFVGLMQRTIFVTCPKDFDMDVNLVCSFQVIFYLYVYVNIFFTFIFTK